MLRSTDPTGSAMEVAGLLRAASVACPPQVLHWSSQDKSYAAHFPAAHVFAHGCRRERESEREGAPKELGCHGSSAVAMDYELRMSPREYRKSYQRAHEEPLGSQHGPPNDN